MINVRVKSFLIKLCICLLSITFVAAAIYVINNKPYESGDDIGYNLGLVGGIGMLTLLLYPLRKRFSWLDWSGTLPSWFKYHMIIGISAPILVLFHSNFEPGALNSAVALYSMLIVAVSGMIGRFIYRHTHKSLYGQILTIDESERMVKEDLNKIRTELGTFPLIETRLEEYKEYAFSAEKSLISRIKLFLFLRLRGRIESARMLKEIKNVLNAATKSNKMDITTSNNMYIQYKEVINTFISDICKAAQLKTWERLFSLWHILHIPFLYLLFFSGVVHVIAVHMY